MKTFLIITIAIFSTVLLLYFPLQVELKNMAVDSEVAFDYIGPTPSTSSDIINLSNFEATSWLTDALINLRCPGTGELCCVVYPSSMTLAQALALLNSYGFHNLSTDPQIIIDPINSSRYVKVFQREP